MSTRPRPAHASMMRPVPDGDGRSLAGFREEVLHVGGGFGRLLRRPARGRASRCVAIGSVRGPAQRMARAAGRPPERCLGRLARAASRIGGAACDLSRRRARWRRAGTRPRREPVAQPCRRPPLRGGGCPPPPRQDARGLAIGRGGATRGHGLGAVLPAQRRAALERHHRPRRPGRVWRPQTPSPRRQPRRPQPLARDGGPRRLRGVYLAGRFRH